VVDVEREALAPDVELAAASEREEDLLLAVSRVVVRGVVLAKFGGMSMIAIPNDWTPSSARTRLNAPP